MSRYDSPTTVAQSVQSANSPEVVTLRTGGNVVPDEFSGYHVEKAVITETANSGGEVGIQNYDDDNSTIEREVTFRVGAQATIEPGADEDHPVIRIERGNQIRIRTGADVEVTLYLVPDGF